MHPSITALLITKNESAMIANCIETLRWCDEIVVLDNDSEDTTAAIAQSMGARVVTSSSRSFAQLRMEALALAKTTWVFYIDADERVLPTLSREIQVHCETDTFSALRMVRQNMMYGKILSYGGWGSDMVTRVFRRSALQGWIGKVHETPKFTGEVVTLHAPVVHLTHRNTIDGLRKTIEWTPIEAELLFQAKAPAATFFTVFRKGSMEFVRRAFFQQGYRDGTEGLIEAVVQGINRCLVYILLWEKQRKQPLSETYAEQEKLIAQEWRKVL